MNATIEKEFYDTMQLLAQAMNETNYDHPQEEDVFKAWYTLNNYPLTSGMSIFIACSCLNLLNLLNEQEKKAFNLDQYFIKIYDAIKNCNSTLINTHANQNGFVLFSFYNFIFTFSYNTTTSKNLVPKKYFDTEPIVFDNVRKKKSALTIFNMAMQKISKYETPFSGRSLECVLKFELDNFKKGGYIKEGGSFKKVKLGYPNFTEIDIKELKQKLEIIIKK